MRIWFQKHTIIGRNPWLDNAYERHFATILPPGTSVTLASLPPEAYEASIPADYVQYGQVEVFFSWYFAYQAVVAERAGYDAYVIGTSQDPGLRMARSLVSIPVIGYGESTFALLHGQGIKFGIVGFIPALEEVLAENLLSYGSAASCVGFEYVHSGRQLVEAALQGGDVADLVAAMSLAADRLRARGAQVIVPGEGLPNEALWAAGVRCLGDLPFIDADGVAVITADALSRAKELGIWSAGTTSYHTRRASPNEIDRLCEIFAPAVVSAHKRDEKLSQDVKRG